MGELGTQKLECRLTRAARLAGAREALITPAGTWSFQEFDERVEERALALQAFGCRRDEWIAAALPANAEGLVEWLALLRAGCRPIPLAPRMPEAPRHALLIEQQIQRFIPGPGRKPEPSSAPVHGPLLRSFDAHAPRAGVATSGSTGNPRIAVHSYANHVLSAQGSSVLLPLAPGDRYLLSLPIHHVGGLAILFRCLEEQATLITGGRAEDPAFLEHHQVTHCSMVATQLQRLLAGGSAPGSLRAILLGGGPMDTDLTAHAQRLGLACYTSYGLTEMSSQVVTHPPQGPARILPHRELSIAEDGEILVRGGTLCLGYLKAGELQGVTDAAGWFHTRDLGVWRDGRLEVIGRKDHQFISGGENIQPEAVETIIAQHPSVQRAVIVPVPDREFGQRPVAFIETGQDLDPESLRAWLRERLTPFMIPVAFFPLPPFDGIKPPRQALTQRASELLHKHD